MEMRLYVLLYFFSVGLYVTGDVQIVVVADDLVVGGKMGVMGNIAKTVPCIDNALDVLLAQTVHVAVFDESRFGINHEDAFAVLTGFFVQNDDAGWDARTIEEIGRKPDDTLDITAVDDILAYLALGIATEEHTVRQDARALAITLQRTDDVEQEGVIAVLLWRYADAAGDDRRISVIVDAAAITPTTIDVVHLGCLEPTLLTEWRICNHIIERIKVGAMNELGIVERVARTYLTGLVLMEHHIHFGHTHIIDIFLLSEDGSRIGM